MTTQELLRRIQELEARVRHLEDVQNGPLVSPRRVLSPAGIGNGGDNGSVVVTVGGNN